MFNISIGRDRAKLYATYLFVIGVALILAHMDNQADFLVFRKAASMDLAKRSPYPVIGSASVYSGSSFVYPYLISWIFAPFAALPIWLAEKSFVVVSIVAYLTGLRLIGVKSNFLVISLVLSSVSIISFQMGTLNPILFLAIAATWKFRDRPVVSGLFVAIAVSTKLFLFPLAAFLFLSKRFRAFAAAFALTGGVLGFGFLLGPLSAVGYYHLLTQLARHEGGQGYSLAALLGRLAVGATPASMLAIASSAIIFFLALTIAEPEQRQRGIFLAAVVSSLIITPIMWASYLPLLIPAIAVQDRRQNWLVLLGPASWILVTPDRLGALGDVIGLAVVSASSLLYWRQIRSEAATTPTDCPQNQSQGSTQVKTGRLRAASSYSLAFSYLALAVISLFGGINLAPAVAVQITLVVLCLLTFAPSQRYPASHLVSSMQ